MNSALRIRVEAGPVVLPDSGLRIQPIAIPIPNGTSTDAQATEIALPRILPIAGRSISKPTTNMNSTKPTFAITVRNGLELTGKSSSGRCPGNKPSSSGPSARPARISAMTGGWFRLRSSHRTVRHDAVTTARPSMTCIVAESPLGPAEERVAGDSSSSNEIIT